MVITNIITHIRPAAAAEKSPLLRKKAHVRVPEGHKLPSLARHEGCFTATRRGMDVAFQPIEGNRRYNGSHGVTLYGGYLMTEKIARLKKVIFALIAALFFSVFFLTPTSAPARATGDDFDAAAVYKAKCAMCHGAKSEKKFDSSKPDEQLVEAVLKGRDSTPKMPAYEKTYNAEQAKALVTYMRSLPH